MQYRFKRNNNREDNNILKKTNQIKLIKKKMNN